MARLSLFILLLLVPAIAHAQSCPAPLASAHRLVLVTAPDMTSAAARLQTFERASPTAPWHALGAPVSALVGTRGIGWVYGFRQFAQRGEPIKTEGDKRTPAGFFPIGRSFGFAPSKRPGYLRIESGTVCVDDPRSPAYNTITGRAKVGRKVHGENMRRVPAYRRGLLVEYPTDRAARAGSCVFIHLRLPGKIGTSGCVALAARPLTAVQDFAQEKAVLAVLSRQALARFKGCLPEH